MINTYNVWTIYNVVEKSSIRFIQRVAGQRSDSIWRDYVSDLLCPLLMDLVMLFGQQNRILFF